MKMNGLISGTSADGMDTACATLRQSINMDTSTRLIKEAENILEIVR
jgi:hypothetical protein